MAAARFSRTCALAEICSARPRTNIEASQHLTRLARAAQQTGPSVSHHSASPPPHLDFLAPAWIHGARSAHSARQPLRSPAAAAAAAVTARRPPAAAARLCARPRRSFSTTTPRHSTEPGAPARAILNPRTAEDGTPLAITITARAAQRLQAIAATDNNPALALRVTVESGGCHGFQYLMSLTSTGAADADEDTIFENAEVVPPPAVKGKEEGGGGGSYKAKVIMDEPSLELLKGSSVDYTMELIGSQFKVTGIPGAKSSCGCGTSFDISL